MKLRELLSVSAAFSLLANQALGAGTSPPAFPAAPGFKGGMEVELMDQHLAGLTPFFDFAHLQNVFGQHLTLDVVGWPGFLDDYLRDHPKALAELPAELRAKLTQGLKLDSLVLRQDGAPAKGGASKLILPGERAQALAPPKLDLGAGRPALQLGAKPLEKAPKAKVNLDGPRMQERGGMIVPERLDWETLYERWAKLSFAEKKELVNWEYLSPKHKAAIMFAASRTYSEAAELKLRPDLDAMTDEKTAAMLRRLEWLPDGSTLEFKHAAPVDSPALLYEDLVRFGRLAGVELKILDNDNSRIKGMSFHYHVSVPGADLDAGLGDRINKFLFVSRVAKGIISDFEGGDYTHRERYDVKGLIKAHSSNRVEIRAHPLALKEEMPKVVRWMSLPNEEALREVDNELRGLMTEETIDRFLRHKSYKILKLVEYLPPERREPIRRAAIEFLREAIESSEHSVMVKARSFLNETPFWPAGLWEVLGKSGSGEHALEALALNLKNEIWRAGQPGGGGRMPAEVWAAMPSLVEHLRDKRAGLGWLARQLNEVEHWPEEFWRTFPSIMKAEPPQASAEFLRELNPKHWPRRELLAWLLGKNSGLSREFRAKLLEKYNSSGSCERLFARAAFRAKRAAGVSESGAAAGAGVSR